MRLTPPNSALLDKSVIKRYYEFLRRSVAGQVATQEQEACTAALLLLSRQGNKLYMTTETKNVLQGRSPVVVLVNHFHNNLSAIEQRFHAMITQLPDPYDHLTLPQLLTTEDIIRQFLA